MAVMDAIRHRKGWTFLLALCLFLTGCSGPSGSSQASLQTIMDYPSENSSESSSESSSENSEDSSPAGSSLTSGSGSFSGGESSANTFELTIAPGAYLTDILKDLHAEGVGASVEELIRLTETLDVSGMGYYREAVTEAGESGTPEKTFLAEGYIAPGTYTFSAGEETQDILKSLLGSWDELMSDALKQEVSGSGYTFAQILTMASLIEYESSYTGSGRVRSLVSSVIRNRLDSGMPLQMDVTVFYLSEALEPYRDPQAFQSTYNTYETAALPAGPIGSPSLESVKAALEPAQTDYLFFIYDDMGNYYFAADYETHLANIGKYLE